MAKIKETEEREEQTINLLDLYKISSDVELSVKITSRNYANHAFIQSTGRDIYIDFLEFPGIKEDNARLTIPGVRIYLTHAAAQSTAQALIDLLERVSREGKIDQYKPKIEGPK